MARTLPPNWPIRSADCSPIGWVGNFHKFPCAPRGTALLVVPPEGDQDGQDLWPLIDSWGFADPFPERFDEQGTQDLCGPIAAPESLREIERLWGWDAVRRYMSDLADYAERRVSEAASEVGGELYLRLTAHAYVTTDAIDRFAEQSIPTIVGWLRG